MEARSRAAHHTDEGKTPIIKTIKLCLSVERARLESCSQPSAVPCGSLTHHLHINFSCLVMT
ncbi:hypothetical protein E2C01_022221 [Portunus trituberculatus]|uniref:Uncharacterized protein n=1 Tax=Portunus trituberculatus TaxID=210409 RepID=A0A5B7E6P3_PORTR|nr:hypothetical protein [Portunus trituberculatus]